MRIFLTIILAFAAGFIANRVMSPEKLPESPLCEISQCEALSSAKKDLVSLSQSQYWEYTQIKDLKQKYEKADELLGKVMLLFLADVGFKLQNKNELVALDEPTPVTAQAKIKAAVPRAAEIPPQLPGVLSGKSSKLKSARADFQIKDALDKSIIGNPKLESMNGSYPNRQQLKILEGLFTGYIRFLDTKREPVSVSWELRPDYSHNPVEGQFNLKLSGGETNSETSGTGEFSNISALADDRGGFIVESCGGKCYLQLYSTTAEQLVGNYYEAKSAKNFDRVGYIEMRK